MMLNDLIMQNKGFRPVHLQIVNTPDDYLPYDPSPLSAEDQAYVAAYDLAVLNGLHLPADQTTPLNLTLPHHPGTYEVFSHVQR